MTCKFTDFTVTTDCGGITQCGGVVGSSSSNACVTICCGRWSTTHSTIYALLSSCICGYHLYKNTDLMSSVCEARL